MLQGVQSCRLQFAARAGDMQLVRKISRQAHETSQPPWFDPRGFGLRVTKCVEPKLHFAERGND